MKLPTIDAYDALTLAGVALLTIAVWVLAGWPALLGLWGVLLVLAGVVGAHRAGRI